MPDLFLTATERQPQGKAVRIMRRQGRIPAVVYGHGMSTQHVALDAGAFQRVWQKAGESMLVDLRVDDHAPVKVLIQDLQLDPRNNAVLHVDLHQVKMTEKVQVEVPLEFTGESPAVKELGGTLVKVRDAIKVECLPADLVKTIPVGLARLKTFDDVIRVGDLGLPHGLTLLERPEDFVAQVEAPRTEAELAELETAVEEDVTKVEKVEEPKKEQEEEPSEGGQE